MTRWPIAPWADALSWSYTSLLIHWVIHWVHCSVKATKAFFLSFPITITIMYTHCIVSFSPLNKILWPRLPQFWVVGYSDVLSDTGYPSFELWGTAMYYPTQATPVLSCGVQWCTLRHGLPQFWVVGCSDVLSNTGYPSFELWVQWCTIRHRLPQFWVVGYSDVLSDTGYPSFELWGTAMYSPTQATPVLSCGVQRCTLRHRLPQFWVVGYSDVLSDTGYPSFELWGTVMYCLPTWLECRGLLASVHTQPTGLRRHSMHSPVITSSLASRPPASRSRVRPCFTPVVFLCQCMIRPWRAPADGSDQVPAVLRPQLNRLGKSWTLSCMIA